MPVEKSSSIVDNFKKNGRNILSISCLSLGSILFSSGLGHVITGKKISSFINPSNLPAPIDFIINRLDKSTPIEKLSVGANILFICSTVYNARKVNKGPN